MEFGGKMQSHNAKASVPAFLHTSTTPHNQEQDMVEITHHVVFNGLFLQTHLGV